MFGTEHTLLTLTFYRQFFLIYPFVSIVFFLLPVKVAMLWISLVKFNWCDIVLTFLSSFARFPTLLQCSEFILFFPSFLYMVVVMSISEQSLLSDVSQPV